MELESTLIELDLEPLKVRKAALVFRATNHKLRQQILKLIHESKAIDVTSIYKALRLVQSVASQHLAILRKAGLVTTKRVKRHVFYSVNYKRLEDIGQIAEQLLAYS